MQRYLIAILGLGLSLNVYARGGDDGSSQRPHYDRPQGAPQGAPQAQPQSQQPAARPLSPGEMLQIAEEAVMSQARKEHPRGESVSVSLEMGKVTYENATRARIKGNGFIRTPNANERIFYNVGIDLRTNHAFDALYHNNDSNN